MQKSKIWRAGESKTARKHQEQKQLSKSTETGIQALWQKTTQSSTKMLQ